MNEFYGKAIEHAAMHNVIHYPGLGQFGPTLNVNQKASLIQVTKMEMGDSFVVLYMKGPQNKTATILVPLTGFTHIVMAKE